MAATAYRHQAGGKLQQELPLPLRLSAAKVQGAVHRDAHDQVCARFRAVHRAQAFVVPSETGS